MIKRLLLLAALAAALRLTGLLPFQTSDVAQLKPVEALVVSLRDGDVVLNGGDSQGRGETWDEALGDLRQGAEGNLCLGTAEQVVLCGDAVGLLKEIAESEDLRPAAVICRCPEGEPDPKQAAAYLSAHNAGLTLRQVRAKLLRGEWIQLPVLAKTEGGLRLNGTEDR